MDIKEKDNPVENMKDRIIRESIRLFLRTSFKGTSIQHITDTLGITKGAFYWHFKSKDELLETIIKKYNDEFLENIYAHLKDFQGDFLKRFREYHKFINKFALHNSEIIVLFVTLSAEMAGSNSPAEKLIKNVQNKYCKFIEALLQTGKSEGIFGSEYDTTLNAHIIIAIHSGVLLQWYMNRKEIDGRMLGRTYYDILLYGMIKRDGKENIPSSLTPLPEV